MDNSSDDQRLSHKREPNVEVSMNDLKELGVEYWRVEGESDPKLKEIREKYGYSYSDVINVSSDSLPNYESALKMFFTEHLHDDDEIRFCLEGSGYFDVRADNDKDWIRIKVEANDMISLPAGIYHRFTLDEDNYIKGFNLTIGFL